MLKHEKELLEELKHLFIQKDQCNFNLVLGILGDLYEDYNHSNLFLCRLQWDVQFHTERYFTFKFPPKCMNLKNLTRDHYYNTNLDSLLFMEQATVSPLSMKENIDFETEHFTFFWTPNKRWDNRPDSKKVPIEQWFIKKL